MTHLSLLAMIGAVAVLGGCTALDAQTPPARAVAITPAPVAAVPLDEVRDRLPHDEIIYFVLPDRFANGDSANDRGGLPGGRLQTGYDPTHKGFYHGGDLRGLMQRIDYIEGLGATAIWLAPIFANKPVQGGPGEESAGYHGYWVTDFTRVDPHFGSDEDFRSLVDAAHARGMKVYMDIITNHTADVIQYAECPNSACRYRSIADYPDHAYTPHVRAEEAAVKVPAWLNDPIYYHNRGNSTFRGESSLLGDFVGLDDLATEDPTVVAGMIEIYAGWIDRFGIDGFRVDTARHVNPEFWQAFVPAIMERARARGIPNFHIFGEVANDGINPGYLARHTLIDGFPAVLDFAFMAAVRDSVAMNHTNEGFELLFRGDALYRGGESAALGLPTFLGNHDAGRFATFMVRANPQAGDAERLARMRLAHAMMLTMRGVPTLYYGDEQGFVGDGGDQDAREDMFASRVASYNNNDLIGGDATTRADNYDPDHPLYRTIAGLSAIRRAHPALRRGRQVLRHVSDGPGLLALSRIDAATGEQLLIVFNTAVTAQSGQIAVDRATVRFTALAGDCPARVRQAGSASVTLPAFGYMICAAEPQ